MDNKFWMGLIIGFLGSAILWLFQPNDLRQFIGLDPKDAYYVSTYSIHDLTKDKIIGSKIIKFDLDKINWFLESDVPLKLQQGYDFFLTPDGRRCVYLSHNVNQGPIKSYLMKRLLE